MYAYNDAPFAGDAPFAHAGAPQWGAEPVRPTWQLVPRFLVTMIVLPVWWLLLLCLFAALLVFAMFAEVLTVIPGFERGFERVMDATVGRIPIWPRWTVTWPELRHEGDTAFYRARVDAYLDTWTKRASARRKSGAPSTVRTCEVPLRKYRGAGGGYVVAAATARGWEPRPSDPAKEIRLEWPAASVPGAAGPVAGTR
ncbi:hypothetical protein GCM10018785_75090 [Streptomyces longispororuber]|uniref:Uncharacterized protein n=1 Tax=Streptomyces longispororuber TaxID=68230 RepID=A0A919AE54_9ACTN|nr:hypothetical protein [Streptomyces longispororuber]GHF01447.1 hypothetical protein GCM10018785_75090 [Streptomyces longispororuber]